MGGQRLSKEYSFIPGFSRDNFKYMLFLREVDVRVQLTICKTSNIKIKRFPKLIPNKTRQFLNPTYLQLKNYRKQRGNQNKRANTPTWSKVICTNKNEINT